jgi:hypothetical protein
MGTDTGTVLAMAEVVVVGVSKLSGLCTPETSSSRLVAMCGVAEAGVLEGAGTTK